MTKIEAAIGPELDGSSLNPNRRAGWRTVASLAIRDVQLTPIDPEKFSDIYDDVSPEGLRQALYIPRGQSLTGTMDGVVQPVDQMEHFIFDTSGNSFEETITERMQNMHGMLGDEALDYMIPTKLREELQKRQNLLEEDEAKCQLTVGSMEALGRELQIESGGARYKLGNMEALRDSLWGSIEEIVDAVSAYKDWDVVETMLRKEAVMNNIYLGEGSSRRQNALGYVELALDYNTIRARIISRNLKHIKKRKRQLDEQ